MTGHHAVGGIHHITAISGGAARTHAFWQGTLGQRLVKRTVNFDDPGTYHLYYGDRTGTPGSVMTFFPWEGVRPGRAGAGEVSEIAHAVPGGSLDFWQDRLAAAGAPVRRETRFGETRLVAADPDGLALALVEGLDPRSPWLADGIGEAEALRGFSGATLALRDAAATAEVLTGLFGYAEEARETDGAATRLRYRAASGGAPVIDIAVDPALRAGVPGAGTVHHIAFAVPDRAAQAAVREAVAGAGFRVTKPVDRQYFHAIYFRTPGGVLFEVATAEPGFAVDEPVAELGRALRLPPQHEPLRARIEAMLPPLAA